MTASSPAPQCGRVPVSSSSRRPRCADQATGLERGDAVVRPGPGARDEEQQAREAGQPVAAAACPPAPAAGRGRPRPPSRLASSSIARRADQPGHADVLGGDGGTLSGRARRARRTSPASRPSRSSNDGKNRKSVRIAPSTQPATSNAWPGAARVADSTASARPSPNAARLGGPSVSVRWPPTIGTSYASPAHLHALRAPAA